MPKVEEYPKRGTVHLRIKRREEFKRFRSQDIGRPRHTIRVAGVSKRTGRWETHKYVFRKDDVVVRGGRIYPKTPRAKRTLQRIGQRHPKARRSLATKLMRGY